MKLFSIAAAGVIPFVARVLGAIAFMALCGFLAFKAGKEALSDAHLKSAFMAVEQANAPGQPSRVSPQEQWMHIMQSISESLRYAPTNPWALEEMGTHNIRKMRTGPDGKLPMIGVSTANINFRMALKQRPTSPVAWANLALTKFMLNEVDDELFTALRYADELGPSEFAVQEVVIFVSLNLWDKLDATQRSSAVRTVDRAARRDAAKVAKLLQDQNRIELLCGLENPSAKIQEQCNRLKSSANRPAPRSR